jgi:stage V sporulation protein SpoVS
MSKTKQKKQHRRQPVKLAHGKTYADVLAERRSAERLQAFVDSANQAVKALSAAAQQLNEAKAKIDDLRSIEEEKKRQADPGR